MTGQQSRPVSGACQQPAVGLQARGRHMISDDIRMIKTRSRTPASAAAERWSSREDPGYHRASANITPQLLHIQHCIRRAGKQWNRVYGQVSCTNRVCERRCVRSDSTARSRIGPTPRAYGTDLVIHSTRRMTRSESKRARTDVYVYGMRERRGLSTSVPATDRQRATAHGTSTTDDGAGAKTTQQGPTVLVRAGPDGCAAVPPPYRRHPPPCSGWARAPAGAMDTGAASGGGAAGHGDAGDGGGGDGVHTSPASCGCSAQLQCTRSRLRDPHGPHAAHHTRHHGHPHGMSSSWAWTAPTHASAETPSVPSLATGCCSALPRTAVAAGATDARSTAVMPTTAVVPPAASDPASCRATTGEEQTAGVPLRAFRRRQDGNDHVHTSMCGPQQVVVLHGRRIRQRGGRRSVGVSP